MFPFKDVGAEPKLDLFVGVFDGVRAVTDVSASDDAVISSDGSWVGGQGIGGSEDETTGSDDTDTFPDHADDGAWKHVVDEGGEEGSFLEVSIVLFKEFLGGLNHLKGSEVVSSFFEASDDFADKSSLDAIRFDHDVASFHRCWINYSKNPQLQI